MRIPILDKWNATITFTSPAETMGDLEIKIQADSVDTGSGLRNGKLKGKDFFDVEQNPMITFVSTKIVQTGHNTYEVDGNDPRNIESGEVDADGFGQGHRHRGD